MLKNKRSSTSTSDALQRGSQSEKSPLANFGKTKCKHTPSTPPTPSSSLLNTHHVATTLSQVQSPDSSALNSSDIKDLKSRRSDLFSCERRKKKIKKTAALLSLRCTIRGICLKMSASTHSCQYFCSSCPWLHVCILKMSLIFIFLGKMSFHALQNTLIHIQPAPSFRPLAVHCFNF